MAGLTSGGFYDRYQRSRQISGGLLNQMGAGTGHSVTTRPKEEDEGKNLGGAIAAAGGGAASGAMLGAHTGTPFGVGAGAMWGGVAGLASYMFS